MTSISRERCTESVAADWSSESFGPAAGVGVAASDDWEVESAAGAASAAAAMCWSRALARLSVRARTLAIWAWPAAAALASAAPPATPLQPAAVRASSATPNHALRATGLSLRAGGLDERAHLEFGLEQR